MNLFKKLFNKQNKEKNLSFDIDSIEKVFCNTTQAIATHRMVYDSHETAQTYVYINYNQAFLNNTGLSSDSRIIGKDVFQVFPDLEYFWLIRYDKILKKGKPETFEDYSDYIQRYYKVTVIPLNKTDFVTIFDDITEYKEIQQKLIVEKEKAEQNDKLKSSFLANTSHEIRTPLNGIIGFSNLLLERDYFEDEDKDFLKIISTAGYKLLNIIDDILDMSKIESGEIVIKKEKVNLNSLIKDLYMMFHSNEKITTKNVELTYYTYFGDDESKVYTDKNRLTQILTNLVNNAIKFTDKGDVEFGYRQKKNYLEFYVRDTGIGIEENNQKRIFERFVKEDIISDGAGLGLSIVKLLVELLDGKIWVESEKGIGSMFIFRIPYIKANGKEMPIRENNINKFDNKTFLIVEDNTISMMLLKHILEPTNAKLITVDNGSEAVEKYKQYKNAIDAVLLDIKLPGKSGKEIIKEIREIDKDIPVIAQTANIMQEDKIEYKELGFTDYISKPIDHIKLVNKLRNALIDYERLQKDK